MNEINETKSEKQQIINLANEVERLFNTMDGYES